MKKPRICAVIVGKRIEAAKEIEPLVDLFEVRIDLIGDGWQDVVRQLKKPWIACNRCTDEGGQWQGNEARRIEKLLEAIELGADIVDVELRTKNLEKVVQAVRKRTECLLSYHDLEKTPSLDDLKAIVRRQLKSGADICKVVTTALAFENILTVLELIPEFPKARMISFAMGTMGVVSRILCPLVGGDFTYASIERGKESAEGQITVRELIDVYRLMGIL
jgi:3-dehydroquinate dehydratase-1